MLQVNKIGLSPKITSQSHGSAAYFINTHAHTKCRQFLARNGIQYKANSSLSFLSFYLQLTSFFTQLGSFVVSLRSSVAQRASCIGSLHSCVIQTVSDTNKIQSCISSLESFRTQLPCFMNSLPSCVGSLLHWLSQLPCCTAQLASCVMPLPCFENKRSSSFVYTPCHHICHPSHTTTTLLINLSNNIFSNNLLIHFVL